MARRSLSSAVLEHQERASAILAGLFNISEGAERELVLQAMHELNRLAQLAQLDAMNQQLAEMLRRFGLGEVADKMATTPDPTLWVTVFGMVIGTALAPLIYALVGIAQWLGMKLFRMPGTIERTVSATGDECAAIAPCASASPAPGH